MKLRILGGAPAIPNSWPWITQIIDSTNDYLCGGTLLSEYWVLTAGHCCDGKDLKTVSHITLRTPNKAEVKSKF